MYEILIADDSVLDINCITFLINKYNLPLCPTTAVNGEEALSIIKESDKIFDILFTDIKMPRMDGLMLSREVRAFSPKTKIIIFSGFNDFEYAKTAISIGVQDYLMKPINPEDFCTTLSRVIDSLHQTEQEIIQKQYQNQLLKTHALWMMINQGTVPLELAHLTEDYTGMMLLECEQEFFCNLGLNFQTCLDSILSLSFDYINLYPTRSVLCFKNKSYSLDEIYLEVQTILQFAKETYQQNLYIAFDFQSTNSSLNQLYQTLERQIESRFFFPDQFIYAPSVVMTSKVINHYFNFSILEDDIKIKDYDSLEQHIEEIILTLKNKNNHSMIYAKYCFTELVKTLLKALPPSQLLLPENDISHLAEQIYLSNQFNRLVDMTQNLIWQIKEMHSSDPFENLKTEKIKQYIYQNYAKPLSLEDIANTFYFSPNYLSSIFKKEVGCNLNKFINDYRLQKAKELLISSPMKVHMIGEAVGFNNTSYFCQRFRDYFGESPEIYRQKEQV